MKAALVVCSGRLVILSHWKYIAGQREVLHRQEVCWSIWGRRSRLHKEGVPSRRPVFSCTNCWMKLAQNQVCLKISNLESLVSIWSPQLTICRHAQQRVSLLVERSIHKAKWMALWILWSLAACARWSAWKVAMEVKWSHAHTLPFKATLCEKRLCQVPTGSWFRVFSSIPSCRSCYAQVQMGQAAWSISVA